MYLISLVFKGFSFLKYCECGVGFIYGDPLETESDPIETKPRKLQLLTNNDHTMYPRATALLEQSMSVVERLLEIHI